MSEWIRDVILLLPIAGLVWKAALQSSEITQLRKDVDANHAKLNILRDENLAKMTAILQTIEIRLTKIETRLESWSKEI